MNGKMLVDTCLLFYLVDKTDAKKHDKTRGFFLSFKQKENLFASTQNLREFSSVAWKKSGLQASEINETIEVFFNSFGIVSDKQEDITTANLLVESNRKNFWDALLVATAQRNGISTILTENARHFEKFKRIKAINPLQ